MIQCCIVQAKASTATDKKPQEAKKPAEPKKEEKVKNEFEDESSRIEEKFIKEKDYRHCILCGNLMAPIDDGINICWDCRIKINEKMGGRYGRD